MARTDYPADFDVDYPEHLSHGLVLVKSWLLAIPHLIIIGLFTANAPYWWSTANQGASEYGNAAGISLLGLLVVIAGFFLLFTRRYPRALFDLILGINRWVYRVLAYVALMRDEYPPFRLDQGQHESSDDPAPGGLVGPPNRSQRRPEALGTDNLNSQCATNLRALTWNRSAAGR